jgi:hypothetical protein
MYDANIITAQKMRLQYVQALFYLTNIVTSCHYSNVCVKSMSVLCFIWSMSVLCFIRQKSQKEVTNDTSQIK